MSPKTEYARTDDGVYLAYQAFGEGPPCFVGAPPIFSNIEVLWEDPDAARFLERYSSFCRFVHYDKRGQGMSDRVDEVPTLERRAADMLTIMDATGFDRAFVGGVSEGGTTAAMVAGPLPGAGPGSGLVRKRGAVHEFGRLSVWHRGRGRGGGVGALGVVMGNP